MASKFSTLKLAAAAMLASASFATSAGPATEPVKRFLGSFKTPAKTGKKWDQLKNSDQREQCSRDEFQIFAIENAVLTPWKNAWKTGDLNAFTALLKSGPEQSIAFYPEAGKEKRTFNGIDVYTWSTNRPVKSVSEGLAAYKQILDVQAEILDYAAPTTLRDKSFRFNNVEATMRVSVTGFDQNGGHRSDRGMMRAHFVMDGKTWKLQKLAPLEGETLVMSRQPAFESVAANMNLDKLPVYLRTEAIRRGGYAISVADINGDGKNDMLVGMRDGMKLLMAGANGFVDATAGSGLEALKYVKTAVFADFGNRGVQDLVVTLLQPGKKINDRGHSSVMAFTGDGKGHFAKKNVDFGSKRDFMEPMPAAVGDFNNDGYLDLYVGYPGIRDFTTFNDKKEIRQVQGLYINDRKGGFTDFSDNWVAADSDFKRFNRVFPHASMAVNFDQKGGIDLLIADDRNNLSPVFVNDGQGKFKQVAEQIGLGNQGYGMSMAAGDFNNDGVTDIIWTNVNMVSATRMHEVCPRHWGMPTKFGEQGLRLFKGLGNGKFEESTLSAGLMNASGEGGAGVSFLDYDNDGYQDIYLVNGLWSGTKNGQDLGTIFSTLAIASDENMILTMKAENSLGFKDVLGQMKGSIDIAKMAIAPGTERPSMAGFQRNKLFRNNGNGTFTEIAFFEGVDSIADGYVVGTATNEQGNIDLVLRNGDPGTADYQFPVVEYFRNNTAAKGNAVILTFEGKKSNKDAFGTFAIANFGDGQKQVQHLAANSGSVQSERTIHFGMGARKSIASIEIHWPSGDVQMLKDVKPGRRHVIEDSAVNMAAQ